MTATIQVGPISHDDRSAWDAIACTSDDAWLGHLWEWNRSVEEDVWGAGDRSIALRSASRMIGIVPLHWTERRIGPLRRRLLFSNRWGEGGIALANDLSPGDRHAAVVAAISGIDEVARGLGVDKAIVRWPALARRSLTSEGSEMGKFLAQGFRDRSNQALVVRLNNRSRAELWSALSSSCRGRVRHALKAGVVVTTPSRQDVMDRYYELHVETYRRTRARPHPRKYFDTILRSEWSKVFFAELNGQVVAALNLALFEGRAAYWTGASRDGAGKIGANNLLQWHAIEWLHSGGFIAYAIGETPPGDLSPQRDPKFHSLTRYKLTFAPTLLPYHRAEHVYRPVGESVVRLVRCLIAR